MRTKKVLSLAVVLAMVLTVVPMFGLTASAAGGEYADKILADTKFDGSYKDGQQAKLNGSDDPGPDKIGDIYAGWEGKIYTASNTEPDKSTSADKISVDKFETISTDLARLGIQSYDGKLAPGETEAARKNYIKFQKTSARATAGDKGSTDFTLVTTPGYGLEGSADEDYVDTYLAITWVFQHGHESGKDYYGNFYFYDGDNVFADVAYNQNSDGGTRFGSGLTSKNNNSRQRILVINGSDAQSPKHTVYYQMDTGNGYVTTDKVDGDGFVKKFTSMRGARQYWNAQWSVLAFGDISVYAGKLADGAGAKVTITYKDATQETIGTYETYAMLGDTIANGSEDNILVTGGDIPSFIAKDSKLYANTDSSKKFTVTENNTNMTVNYRTVENIEESDLEKTRGSSLVGIIFKTGTPNSWRDIGITDINGNVIGGFTYDAEKIWLVDGERNVTLKEGNSRKTIIASPDSGNDPKINSFKYSSDQDFAVVLETYEGGYKLHYMDGLGSKEIATVEYTGVAYGLSKPENWKYGQGDGVDADKAATVFHDRVYFADVPEAVNQKVADSYVDKVYPTLASNAQSFKKYAVTETVDADPLGGEVTLTYSGENGIFDSASQSFNNVDGVTDVTLNIKAQVGEFTAEKGKTVTVFPTIVNEGTYISDSGKYAAEASVITDPIKWINHNQAESDSITEDETNKLKYNVIDNFIYETNPTDVNNNTEGCIKMSWPIEANSKYVLSFAIKGGAPTNGNYSRNGIFYSTKAYQQFPGTAGEGQKIIYQPSDSENWSNEWTVITKEFDTVEGTKFLNWGMRWCDGTVTIANVQLHKITAKEPTAAPVASLGWENDHFTANFTPAEDDADNVSGFSVKVANGGENGETDITKEYKLENGMEGIAISTDQTNAILEVAATNAGIASSAVKESIYSLVMKAVSEFNSANDTIIRVQLDKVNEVLKNGGLYIIKTADSYNLPDGIYNVLTLTDNKNNTVTIEISDSANKAGLKFVDNELPNSNGANVTYVSDTKVTVDVSGIVAGQEAEILSLDAVYLEFVPSEITETEADGASDEVEFIEEL